MLKKNGVHTKFKNLGKNLGKIKNNKISKNYNLSLQLAQILFLSGLK
jgi:hypothetical protein